jgi:hypothetical protein
MAPRTIPVRKPGVPGQKQQTWQYSVSFEFDLRPVVTAKGTVTASSYSKLVARATKAAQKALRPINVRSLVCVLMERVEKTTALQTASDAPTPDLPDPSSPPDVDPAELELDEDEDEGDAVDDDEAQL